MLNKVLPIVLCLSLGGATVWGEEPQLKDTMDEVNYSVGYQIGEDFQKQGVDMRSEAFLRGIQDAMGSGKPLMTKAQMHEVLVNLKQKIVADQQANRERYRGEGRAFLEKNAKQDGVMSLPNGLQYKILKPGTGKSPTPKDTVLVNYVGKRIDGTEFVNTYKQGEPVKVPLSKSLPGWQEALPKMKEGATWQLFIPADLAFGERGPMADQTVIFEVELLQVVPPES